MRLPSSRTRQGNNRICSCRALAPCLYGLSCLMASGTYRPQHDWTQRDTTIGKHAESESSSVSAIGDFALPSLTIQGTMNDNTDRVQMPGQPNATSFPRSCSEQKGELCVQPSWWRSPTRPGLAAA